MLRPETLYKIDDRCYPKPWDLNKWSEIISYGRLIIRTLVPDGEDEPKAFIALKQRPNALKIKKLAVDPDWQGFGLGVRLMKVADRFASEYAVPIQKMVHEHDDAAINFLRKTGFLAIGMVGDWILFERIV